MVLTCSRSDVGALCICISLVCGYAGLCGCSSDEDDDGQEIDGEDIAWEDDNDEGGGDGDDNSSSSSTSVAAGGRAGCPEFEGDDVEEEPEERRVRTVDGCVSSSNVDNFLKMRGTCVYCMCVHGSLDLPLWDDVLGCPVHALRCVPREASWLFLDTPTSRRGPNGCKRSHTWLRTEAVLAGSLGSGFTIVFLHTPGVSAGAPLPRCLWLPPTQP